MANPVINSVTVEYPNGQSYVAPGQTAVVVVDAVDADNYTLTGEVTVKDTAGNEATTAFEVVVADKLVFSATAERGTVVQDQDAPNKFRVTAEA